MNGPEPWKSPDSNCNAKHEIANRNRVKVSIEKHYFINFKLTNYHNSNNGEQRKNKTNSNDRGNPNMHPTQMAVAMTEKNRPPNINPKIIDQENECFV